MWALWWVWMVAALGLAFVEVMVPGYIFLGFAVGAAITGLAVLLGGAAVGFPLLAVTFAVLSLLSWIVLRQTMGVRKGQQKIWDRDINED